MERIFGNLTGIDPGKTLFLNLLRFVASGIAWALIVSISRGDLLAFVSLAFAYPFAMALAFGMGAVLRILAIAGLPFAGIAEALMRLILMAGDPLLRLFLVSAGERIGLPYVTSWLSFTLLIVVETETAGASGSDRETDVKAAFERAVCRRSK